MGIPMSLSQAGSPRGERFLARHKRSHSQNHTLSRWNNFYSSENDTKFSERMKNKLSTEPS